MATQKDNPMFSMIAAILVFLWLLGLVISCTMEGCYSSPSGGHPEPGARRGRRRVMTYASSGARAVHRSPQSTEKENM